MAEVLSGSLSTNNYSTQSSGTIGLKLTWTATQSIENNTSTIKWTLVSKGSMSSGTWVTCYGVEVKINGTKVLNTTSSFHMYGDGKYKKTGTITVAHNASGGKSVAMSVKGKIYRNAWNCTDDGTFTLKTINRYALIASATDFTNESYPKIVYTNPAGTALTTGLKARIVWNERTSYSDWVTLNDDGGEYTFTASTLTAANINSMLALCPDSSYLTVEVDLQSTMNGVDYHNYKSIMMSVVNANPIFSTAVSYQDANPTVVAIAGGRIVRKQSKLRIYHGTAAAQKGASLMPSPYSLYFNGQGYGFLGDYIEFDKPDLAGTYTATIKAIDTRGNESASVISFTVLDWTEPTADCSLERQNSFEATCDLKVTAHISSLDGRNASYLSITEKHRVVGSSTWSSAASVANDTTVQKTLANTDAWEMEISVSDAFYTATYRLTVGKGIPFIYKDTHRSSVAINGIPDDDDQLYVGGTIKTTGKITAPSMSVQDISSQYSSSRTSGGWTVNSIEAFRTGNVVDLSIEFKGNGSAVASGSNAFVGVISGGPLPIHAVRASGFYGGNVLICALSSSQILVRICVGSVTLATNAHSSFNFTFIVND